MTENTQISTDENKSPEEDQDPKEIQRNCRYCAQPIAMEAKVCHHCSRHQNRIVSYSAHFNLIPTLVSIGLLTLAVMQFSDAKVERVAAGKALKEAQVARTEIEQTAKDLREIVKAVVENSYILGSSSFLAMHKTSPAKERLEENLDKLSRFAEPDETVESEWWDSLHDLYPERQKPE